MKNRFKRMCRWLAYNGHGKTWFVFWLLSVLTLYMGGEGSQALYWLLLMFAYQAQRMANMARTAPELQDWFDEVNAARVKRIHKERIAAVLTAHGMRSDRASSISSTTVDVLDIAQYRFAAV